VEAPAQRERQIEQLIEVRPQNDDAFRSQADSRSSLGSRSQQVMPALAYAGFVRSANR
jgi:hypothetical protein